MRCSYCETEVVNYPDNGICVNCGGRLPPRPAAEPAPPAYNPAQPVHIHVHQTSCGVPMVACPRCGSTQVVRTNRGFSWGLAILGFFLFPLFGLLLGFCGSKKSRLQCTACSRKWKTA